jgi:RHH-type transcriptional regulator, rel operon repressor / antitoxin RelB
MTVHTAIQIPEDTFERLKSAATELGETPSNVVLAAIEGYLEDREDVRRADEILDQIHSGKMRTYTLEEVERELGLDD